MTDSKFVGGLGFHDLNLFNTALLAKQCWRLILNDNSLSDQVMKAKYFPRSSILSTTGGYCPSYLWRSLCQATTLLSKGLCWRVGNGRSIRIWNDNWIIELNHKRPLLWKKMSDDTIVAELIDPDLYCWKSNLIHRIFLPFEANSIMWLPICYRLPEYILFWINSKNGSFSVRSGYFLAKQMLSNNLFNSNSLAPYLI